MPTALKMLAHRLWSTSGSRLYTLIALMPSLCMIAASLKHVDPSLKGSEPGLYADDPPKTHLVTNSLGK